MANLPPATGVAPAAAPITGTSTAPRRPPVLRGVLTRLAYPHLSNPDTEQPLRYDLHDPVGSLRQDIAALRKDGWTREALEDVADLLAASLPVSTTIPPFTPAVLGVADVWTINTFLGLFSVLSAAVAATNRAFRHDDATEHDFLSGDLTQVEDARAVLDAPFNVDQPRDALLTAAVFGPWLRAWTFWAHAPGEVPDLRAHSRLDSDIKGRQPTHSDTWAAASRQMATWAHAFPGVQDVAVFAYQARLTPAEFAQTLLDCGVPTDLCVTVPTAPALAHTHPALDALRAGMPTIAALRDQP